MTKETIQKCIDLLNTDGINSKEQVKKILQGELEAIDNANPSEALECLENIWCDISTNYVNEYVTIKQALLKAQEPKHYIKWEDLEFGVPTSLPATIKVKMGDTQYLLSLRVSLSGIESVVLRDNNLKPFLHLFEKEKQFFNDLHLERVEE